MVSVCAMKLQFCNRNYGRQFELDHVDGTRPSESKMQALIRSSYFAESEGHTSLVVLRGSHLAQPAQQSRIATFDPTNRSVGGFNLIPVAVVRNIQQAIPVSGSFGGMTDAFAAVSDTWLWIKNVRLARRQASPLMEAQWRFFRSKSVCDYCVLASLCCTLLFHHYAWSIYIDTLFSFVLSGFLLWSAYLITADSVYDLLDRSPDAKVSLGKAVQHEPTFRRSGVEARCCRRGGWSGIAAVRNGEIHEIKSALILQPGPAALTEGVAQLHDIIARVATPDRDRS
jgi:hypothetical protein